MSIRFYNYTFGNKDEVVDLYCAVLLKKPVEIIIEYLKYLGLVDGLLVNDNSKSKFRILEVKQVNLKTFVLPYPSWNYDYRYDTYSRKKSKNFITVNDDLRNIVVTSSGFVAGTKKSKPSVVMDCPGLKLVV